MVRALFVQLKNQFSRKRISADFIVLWPTRKWKIKFTWHISFFLSVAKRKTEFRNARSFCLFSKNNFRLPFSFSWRKQRRNYAFLFPFSEESIKRIQKDGFLFLFSEESIKGIANHAILIPFSLSEGNTKRNLEWWIPFFYFRTKAKQEIGFACTLQVASFPGSPRTWTSRTRLLSRSIQLHLH